jgi:hypothetical protein
MESIPMPTKKEFQAIAEILRWYQDKIDADTFSAMLGDFATQFRKQNPSFDESRFFAACRKPFGKLKT